MVKKFTIPFASQGDANDIPDALQVDGKVSFTQGFGYDYERPYDDPQAKDIAREDMNGLFKAITSAVGELQTLGASEWSNAASYPKGSIVYHEKDLYISQVDDNQNKPPQNWVSITSIANDSLKKAANLSDLTNKATARNNLGLGSSATLNKTDFLGTSTSLVATQKLVNDTKINLESSKQDKLTFSGTGNVARMSEVDKKMNEGAHGLGDTTLWLASPEDASVNGFYGGAGDTSEGWFGNYSPGIVSRRGTKGETSRAFILNMHDVRNRLAVKFDINGNYSKWYEIATLDDIPAVTQSAGSSTTNVMSQKAVTDRLNSIESGHGLGYGQNWVDVTSQRVLGTTYTNNTGKPIFIVVTVSDSSGNARIYVDEVAISHVDRQGSHNTSVYAIIPNRSSYRADSSINLLKWFELR